MTNAVYLLRSSTGMLSPIYLSVYHFSYPLHLYVLSALISSITFPFSVCSIIRKSSLTLTSNPPRNSGARGDMGPRTFIMYEYSLEPLRRVQHSPRARGSRSINDQSDHRICISEFHVQLARPARSMATLPEFRRIKVLNTTPLQNLNPST